MILSIKKYLTITVAVLATFFVALARAFLLGKKSSSKNKQRRLSR